MDKLARLFAVTFFVLLATHVAGQHIVGTQYKRTGQSGTYSFNSGSKPFSEYTGFLSSKRTSPTNSTNCGTGVHNWSVIGGTFTCNSASSINVTWTHAGINTISYSDDLGNSATLLVSVEGCTPPTLTNTPFSNTYLSINNSSVQLLQLAPSNYRFSYKFYEVQDPFCLQRLSLERGVGASGGGDTNSGSPLRKGFISGKWPVDAESVIDNTLVSSNPFQMIQKPISEHL